MQRGNWKGVELWNVIILMSSLLIQKTSHLIIV